MWNTKKYIQYKYWYFEKCGGMCGERNYISGSLSIKFKKIFKVWPWPQMGLEPVVKLVPLWGCECWQCCEIREGDFGLRIGIFSPVIPNFPVIRQFKFLIILVIINCRPKVKKYPSTNGVILLLVAYSYPQLFLKGKQHKGRGHTQYPFNTGPSFGFSPNTAKQPLSGNRKARFHWADIIWENFFFNCSYFNFYLEDNCLIILCWVSAIQHCESAVSIHMSPPSAHSNSEIITEHQAELCYAVTSRSHLFHMQHRVCFNATFSIHPTLLPTTVSTKSILICVSIPAQQQVHQHLENTSLQLSCFIWLIKT